MESSLLEKRCPQSGESEDRIGRGSFLHQPDFKDVKRIENRAEFVFREAKTALQTALTVNVPVGHVGPAVLTALNEAG
jgi:hypothetical protein